MYSTSWKRTLLIPVFAMWIVYVLYQHNNADSDTNQICVKCMRKEKLEERFDFSTLEKIHQLIWSQIHSLQEKGDCRKKKILVCDADGHFAGFGSMVHRYGVCMHVAFGLGRLVIINSKHYDHFGGLNKWLLPLSKKCSYLKKKYPEYSNSCNLSQTHCYKNNGYDVNNTYKVLEFAPRPMFPYPRHVPGAIPKVIEKALLMLEIEDPKMWLSAQFLGYLLLRSNRYFKYTWKVLSKRVNFRYPVVSMHIRHGDKLIKEAKYVKEERFLKAAERYFNTSLPNTSPWRIYVASDDKNIEKKLNSLIPTRKFKLLFLPRTYRNEGLKSYTKENFPAEVIESIFVDIYFLVYSNYTICTYTSNICRLVNLLRQARQPYKIKNKIESLDTEQMFYEYFGYSYERTDKFRVSINANNQAMYHNTTKLLQYQKGELFKIETEKSNLDEHLLFVKRKHSKKYDSAGYVKRNDVATWPGYPEYFFYKEKSKS